MTVQAGVPTGAIRPGDHVDVLATFGGQHPHTETVATGLEVLLVLDPGGSDEMVSVASGTGSGGPTLVLLVSPTAAEDLA